ncbi:MAG: phosphomannomutase/phosphoglucomutase [Candidatus Thermoplasmatota archaeon]|nr:phosphomannomutase/phosphoglucomutase [Candidatus Thermoplasmatota archaeon]
MDQIFRAYDIRGIWGQDLDVQTCLDIGRGLGTLMGRDLGMKGLALGFDVRKTSETFHGALVAGLLSCGIDVLSTGQCGFGVAMFAGWREGLDASCYITASHLEPEWNGLKIYFGDGVGFPSEHIEALRDLVLNRDFIAVDWKETGTYTEKSYLEEYVSFWKERYGPYLMNKGFKIGMDCGGGAMCLSAPYVLAASGARVELINGEVDPMFEKRPSEPRPENLGELREAVIDGGLEFGIAFDGDGDRAVVVDDKGRFMTTDRLGIIISRDIIERKGGGVVLANVESSMAIEDVLVPMGAEVKRIKVGHTYLTLEAKRTKAVFGVERSGHLIVPEHVLFDDAIFAPLELLRIISLGGRKLSDLSDEVPQYPSGSRTFSCPDHKKFEVVDILKDHLRARFDRIDDQDGVRVDTMDGWVLVRCSNTSPVIRMTVEARSDEMLDALITEFGNMIEAEIAACVK